MSLYDEIARIRGELLVIEIDIEDLEKERDEARRLAEKCIEWGESCSYAHPLRWMSQRPVLPWKGEGRR